MDGKQCDDCGHPKHAPGLCTHPVQLTNTGVICCKCDTTSKVIARADHLLKSEPTGVKHDQGKAPLDLLDPDALEGLARVLEFGAKKYAADNWRGGIKYRRILGAILRHTFAILRCHDTDPESGLPAVDHLFCEAMFLSYFMKNRTDLDDRWKEQG